MKVAVFGATGPLGLLVVSELLQRGEVKALVRNPSKLTQTHVMLEVVKTNIFCEKELNQHLPGCDVIISCLGSKPSFSSVSVYSESIKSITNAMKSLDMSRLICLSSWYTRYEPGEPFMFTYMVRPLILGRVLDDIDRMETYLIDSCKDIDYTVLRLPHLTDGGKQEKEVIVGKGTFLKDTTNGMPRANVARFTINCAEQGLYKGKIIAIGLKNE